MKTKKGRVSNAGGAHKVIIFTCILLLICSFSPAGKDDDDTVSAVNDPVIRGGCADSTRLNECLSERDPSDTIFFPFDEWAVRSWLSPDGKILLVSTLKRLSGESEKDDIPALSSIDLEARRLLWRKSLGKKADIALADFLNSDSVLVSDGDTYFAALNPRTGKILWEETCGGKDHCATVDWIDPDKKFVVLGGLKDYLVLDTSNGSTLAKMKSLDREFNPAYSTGQPLITPQGLYLTDGGMIHISRATGEIDWNTRYPTVSNTKGGSGFWGSLLGAAIGGALSGAMYGAGAPYVYIPTMSGGTTGTFNFGRTTTPIDAGDHIVTGALGTVYSIDKATGKISWAKWLPVTHVDELRIAGDRIYALGAGVSLTKSYVSREVSAGTAYRYGLYALQLADGNPVPNFRAPFNKNSIEKALTASDVSDLSPTKVGKQEIKWLRSDAKILKAQRNLEWEPPEEDADAKDNDAEADTENGDASQSEQETEALTENELPFSFDPIYGLAIGKDALYVGAAKEVLVLDPETGSLKRRIPTGHATPLYSLREVGDFIVLRGFNGITVLSLSSGAMLWSRPTESIEQFSVFQDPGNCGRLHVTRPDWYADEELDRYRAAMYWLDEAHNRIILPENSRMLAALSLADGSVVWRVPIRNRVPVRFDLKSEQRIMFEYDQNTLRMYRVP